MSWKIRNKCLESYFREANVRIPILAKPLLWSPIIAIISEYNDQSFFLFPHHSVNEKKSYYNEPKCINAVFFNALENGAPFKCTNNAVRISD